ncbi:Transposase IS4 [Popillia japonica]|uniref:Transposase IS4 n=1 Tax=Popillia japonica TaxID=7064 RepID=A0AAW1JIK6_POPJA
MADASDNIPGPSRAKKRRWEDKNPLTEAAIAKIIEDELFDDLDSDFEFVSEDEYVPNDDTSETSNAESLDEEENIVLIPTMQQATPGSKVFSFTKTECLLQPVPGGEPIHYFRHILTDNYLDEIIAQTNRYAVEIFLRSETKENSRITAWKDVSNEEMVTFLGLLLHMGNIRLNRIQDYWKTDPLFNLRAFANNMSRNRFLLILRALHFAQNPDNDEVTPPDRLYKIRNIMNLFNSRMGGGKGHTEKVVMNLLGGMMDVGHSLYMDNYYNSYELAKQLAARKTHCTGTLRSNRKSFPKEVGSKKLKRGETIAKYANGIMIGKWKDKRDVVYISNEYKNDMVQIQNKRREIKSKPLPIINYNKYMTGVDRQDQLLAYYPCERKTIRWPSKIFVHILQLIMINAYHLYNKYSGTRLSLYDFRLSVIGSLLKQPPKPDSGFTIFEHTLDVREESKKGKVITILVRQ